MNEEWRPVVGYEGLYEVSSYGRVRSLDWFIVDSLGYKRLHKGKVLSPAKDKNGYLKVNLHCNGKHNIIRVHRLVAQAFIPNPDNLPQVNHKDENPSNDNVDNLEWCDQKYNINFGTARIRGKETAIKNGYWTGLSKDEYRKKWYQENTDKLKEYRKKWYQEHKNEYNEKQREYYQKNKDRICEQKKEYYLKKERDDTK